MSEGLLQRMAAIAEAMAERRRRKIAGAMIEAGVEALVEGDAVRLSARGLKRRWLGDLALREAGRGGV